MTWFYNIWKASPSLRKSTENRFLETLAGDMEGQHTHASTILVILSAKIGSAASG